MDKPTVLCVHNRYKIFGGEDSVFESEVELLRQNGHKVVLYTRDNKEIDSLGFFGRIFLPFTTFFSFKTKREIKKIIKREKVDIVHIHNVLNLISPSVYFAAKSCGVPVVRTLHNFRLICPSGILCRESGVCEECIEKGLGCAIKNRCYRKSKLQTLLLVFIIKFYKFIGIYKKINYIALTDFNREKLLEADKKHKMFTDKNVFIKGHFIKEHGEPIPTEKRKNKVVFVGRLEWLKGIDFLLDAWKEIKNTELCVLGDGPLYEKSKKTAEENGMENVKFLGRVSREKVIDELSDARALIFPTQVYEGFPVSVIEAFSCGTPAIVPDFGNAGCLVKDAENGFKYEKGNASSLMAAIDKLLESDLTEKTYGIYKEKYTDKANYEELLSIYLEVLKKKK